MDPIESITLPYEKHNTRLVRNRYPSSSVKSETKKTSYISYPFINRYLVNIIEGILRLEQKLPVFFQIVRMQVHFSMHFRFLGLIVGKLLDTTKWTDVEFHHHN